ncbi:MAG: adenylate/guanylate cyclase domain-containing protein [Thermoleophilia bacterium]|nr:adenylate/guanylate cyclase domain-containing protein [Thermoleophilia bacterium]
MFGETVELTLLLAAFVAVGSNIELKFTFRESGPTYSPVGGPIALAIVACTPAQAMLVVAVGYLFGIGTWRRGARFAIETAGIGAMTAGIAALVAQALGLTFASSTSTLIAAIAGATLFLVLDAATYAIWYQLESGSGRDVVSYFVRTAPVDLTFTVIAAALAGPSVDQPLVAALALTLSQVAFFALYRVMMSESRYRDQSHHLRDTFGRYVPESIVEQLADSTHGVRLGGEEREVTVMFCDIRGFTTWAESQSPEHVVGELNGLLGALAALVLESGGTLDKFTGDGLMAFWGAPLEQPDHATRACSTAFAMQKHLVERARDASLTPFRIGIGITSGTVVVGNVGHEDRLEYTAIGDTVNLAARLEQATKELEITTAMSHETWSLLPPELQLRCPESATVSVRGRTRPVLVHELAGSVEERPAANGPGLHVL